MENSTLYFFSNFKYFYKIKMSDNDKMICLGFFVVAFILISPFSIVYSLTSLRLINKKKLPFDNTLTVHMC